MGFFEDLSKSVNKVSKDVSTRAKNMSAITKLNSEITHARREINDNLILIGKAALEKKDSGYKEFIDKINAANALIEKNIVEVKALKGVVVCASCGADASMDAKFCGKCGAKLKKPKIDEDAKKPASAPPAGGKTCADCGEVNTKDAEFCAGCGAKLE